MTRLKTLGRIAPLCLLAACVGFGPAGAPIDLDPLPAAALSPCRHPAEFFPTGAMGQGVAEVAVGRMGDALLICGAEKAALAAWAQGARDDVRGAASAD